MLDHRWRKLSARIFFIPPTKCILERILFLIIHGQKWFLNDVKAMKCFFVYGGVYYLGVLGFQYINDSTRWQEFDKVFPAVSFISSSFNMFFFVPIHVVLSSSIIGNVKLCGNKVLCVLLFEGINSQSMKNGSHLHNLNDRIDGVIKKLIMSGYHLKTFSSYLLT